MLRFLTQLESALKKFSSIDDEDLQKKMGEWIGNCKSIVVRMKASISEPKVTSNEFTGHTEQNILYYFNHDQSILERIKATIRKGSGKVFSYILESA
ncbi:MAG: hypothetical protein FJX71_05870 [Alphaproteobacteria bacterium]|nr:hypothetical protein [Alphaproteobacteria bacterium]